MGASDVWSDWANNTSLHGVRNVRGSNSTVPRVSWLLTVFIALGAGFYLSNAILVSYINGETGTKSESSEDRKKIEDLLHLTYCSDDFIDPRKAAKVPNRVLEYGLSLIPDLYFGKASVIMDRANISKSRLTNDDWSSKWAIGTGKKSVPPAKVLQAAEDFRIYVEENGMKTLDEFLESISLDMVNIPNGPSYRNMKVLKRYPRYGMFCYEVSTELNLTAMTEEANSLGLPVPSHVLTFDFLHSVPNLAEGPMEEGVPASYFTTSGTAGSGLLSVWEVDKSKLIHPLQRSDVLLSVSTGDHGMDARYSIQLDQLTGVRPYPTMNGLVYSPCFSPSIKIFSYRGELNCDYCPKMPTTTPAPTRTDNMGGMGMEPITTDYMGMGMGMEPTTTDYMGMGMGMEPTTTDYMGGMGMSPTTTDYMGGMGMEPTTTDYMGMGMGMEPTTTDYMGMGMGMEPTTTDYMGMGKGVGMEPTAQYIPSGELRFRASVTKNTKIKNCHNSKEDLRLPSDRKTRCAALKKQCEERVTARTSVKMCGEPCKAITGIDRSFEAGMKPCILKMWSAVTGHGSANQVFKQLHLFIGCADTAIGVSEECSKVCEDEDLPECVSYSYEVSPSQTMRNPAGEHGITDDEWKFTLIPNSGQPNALDIPRMFEHYYVLRVSIEVVRATEVIEYYLVGVEAMIGAVGGVFGICLGMSAISIVELFTTLFQWCKAKRAVR